MTHHEIREKFRAFMEARGHHWVPSSPLLPTDPSVLFTTAGMQQFKPYYTGAADAMHDFGSRNTASIQKCMRTSDIDEIGDESHLSFFEMLGNFSFGGYFKKEAIQYAYEFITRDMGLTIDYVSVFGGEGELPADTESEQIWKSLDPYLVIKKANRSENFWGPTGNEGPCGPTTEVYVRGVEVWNIVFNQYYQDVNGKLQPLETPGIDTGMGLERLTAVCQNVPTVFETDLFAPIIASLPSSVEGRKRRISADHARAIVFLIADGVRPSNKEQGYVLRRLIRRIMVSTVATGDLDEAPFRSVIDVFRPTYENLDPEIIFPVIRDEAERFRRTLKDGLAEMNKLSVLDAARAFRLFESYGLPYEVIKDIGGAKASDLTREAFDEKFKEHQERSRTASAGMFKGGLADHSEITTKYHTATHLMLAALRRVLAGDIMQKGSNITAERTRFDFSYPQKMTDDQKQKVEQLVNEWIARDLSVTREMMSQEAARTSGALGAFGEKYGETVSVYTVADQKTGEVISKEFCGGPHVEHTGVLGKFKIIKEESGSAGVRRIRAVLS